MHASEPDVVHAAPDPLGPDREGPGDDGEGGTGARQLHRVRPGLDRNVHHVPGEVHVACTKFGVP